MSLITCSVGSGADCQYPICCLSDLPLTSHRTAGYWGDHSCDLPPWTLDATLRHIKLSHHQLDYIILTGDLPAHDVWRQSERNNVESIQVAASALRKYFPDIPVLPAIGNHESFPVNMFPGEVCLPTLLLALTDLFQTPVDQRRSLQPGSTPPWPNTSPTGSLPPSRR